MTIYHKMIQAIQKSAQRQTLSHLKSLSDRQLIDYGFSPYLVSEGIKGWPWRIESSGDECLSSTEQHVEKLQSYPESELDDQRVSSGTIRDCVRKDRTSVSECTRTDEAA